MRRSIRSAVVDLIFQLEVHGSSVNKYNSNASVCLEILMEGGKVGSVGIGGIGWWSNVCKVNSVIPRGNGRGIFVTQLEL